MRQLLRWMLEDLILEAAEADAGGFDAVDVGFGAGDMGMSSGDLAGSDALGGLGEVDVANLGSDVSFGVSPGQAAAQVGTGYGGLLWRRFSR